MTQKSPGRDTTIEDIGRIEGSAFQKPMSFSGDTVTAARHATSHAAAGPVPVGAIATILSNVRASESPIARDNSRSRSHTRPRRQPGDVRRSGSGRPAPRERRRIG